MTTLSAPYFQNDEAARKLIESIRWPEGPVRLGLRLDQPRLRCYGTRRLVALRGA